MTEELESAPHLPPSRIVFGLFLMKLGKHLAVLASLLILGQASDHFDIGQLAIFCLIVLSSIIHSGGKACMSAAPSHRNRS